MLQFTKWFAAALVLGIIGTSIYASGSGQETAAPFPVPLSCYTEDYGSPEFMEAHCDRIHGIKAYRDPEGAGIGGILSHRISVNSFNFIGSLLFLIAILHTFMANKLTAKAHKIHEEHDEKMKAEGASQDEIEHDIPLKAELFHFLGEVEAIFGMWVIALMFVVIGYYDWGTFKNYLVYGVVSGVYLQGHRKVLC